MVGVINSKAEFDAIISSGKVVFIDLYADWCGPCRLMSPEFENLAKTYEKEGVEFFKLDIDAVPDVSSALKIRSIPVFYAYKDGKRLGEPVVGASRGALQTLVTSNLC